MWCCHFPIYICDTKFLIWLRYWSCFRHSNKSGCCSLSIQFHKLLWLWLWFSVNFLLNLGFFCNAVELGGQTTAHGPHAARQSNFSGPSTLIETSIYIYKTQCVSVCLSAIEIKLETFRYKQTYESYVTFSREAKYGILISIRIVYGGLRGYIYSTYIKILELSKVCVRYHKQKKICYK